MLEISTYSLFLFLALTFFVEKDGENYVTPRLYTYTLSFDRSFLRILPTTTTQ